MTNKNLLPGPCESDSHPRNETQIFSVFPLSKRKQLKVHIRSDLLRSGLWGDWRGGGGQAGLSTGRQCCANKCAGYLSSLLVLYGDQAEALGLSSEANMGIGQTPRALLLGLHSPDKLI